MARFALLLPREEMVEPAGRIARELEMDVVLNQSVPTERILDLMEDCRRTGADILVARGRQASILKEHTGFHAAKITRATEIQPRPPTLSRSHTPPLMIIEQYAPPIPQIAPDSSILMYLHFVTSIPAASAAPGFSPIACTFKPTCVLYK